MKLQSAPRFAVARQLLPLGAALIVSAILAVPSCAAVLAQAPPPDGPLTLVNDGRPFVERKADGEFVARPVFDRPVAVLHYGVRDADSGDWITGVYRISGGEQELSDGFEYAWEYPSLDHHPVLDPDRAYLLVMLAATADAPAIPSDFYAVIPFYEPTRIWDRILAALDPSRWAKAFAGWVIEGVHGALCSVVERLGGGTAANCREASA